MAPKRRSTTTADSRRVRTFTGSNPPTPTIATTSPSLTSATVRVHAPLDSIAAAHSPPSRVVQYALNKIHAPIADANPHAKPPPRASPQPSATTNGEPLSDLHHSTSTSSADQSPTDNPAVVNTSVAGTQIRLGRGRHHLPPAPSRLNGNLQFTNANERARYAFVSTLPIVQGKILHAPTVQILSLNVDVLIAGIGWDNFFAITCPIYYELVWEFYSTFSADSLTDCTLDTAGIVQFRLMGQRFAYSLTEFNKVPSSRDPIESSKKEVLYVQLLLPQPWLILHLTLNKLFRPSTPELIRWRVDSKTFWSVLPLI
ncbi:uncharacterized protein LOC122722268 [Manihot esculenta]|uniref:uncharacterized protein LOC122722268 n=1 Tax=Manihot esculenta TaxID=3983 RepID=UPI001CC42463|nr:uncharacterized protein LOC122722268 [Manihot esculenta]